MPPCLQFQPKLRLREPDLYGMSHNPIAPCRLTVAIPTYNRAAFLETALQRLIASINESGAAVEIVVLDNASTDETPSVVQRLAASHPITYLRHPTNIGANPNCAAATRCGSGEYLWILGDDDYPTNTCVGSLLRLLGQRPDYVILNYDTFLPDLKRYWGRKWFGNRVDRVLAGRNATMRYLASGPGFISCVVARRNILSCLSPQDEEKWAQYGFNQLYAFYVGLPAGCEGVITADVMLLVNHASSGAVEYDWNRYFITGLGSLFTDLGARHHYIPWAVRTAHFEIVERYLGRRLVSLRAAGDDWRKFARLTWRQFGWISLLSPRFMSGLILPAVFLTELQKMKRP